MRSLTIAEFHAEIKAQGVKHTSDVAFKCVVCDTVQSMADFVAAGCSIKEAESFIGFSCIGRQTNAGPFRKGESKPGAGCDWSLGGLFKLHVLEVVDNEGRAHSRFELASPAEAQAHALARKVRSHA
jgi:hypothetical protein